MKEEKMKFYFIVHILKKKKEIHKGVPLTLKSCQRAVTDSLLMTGDDFQEIQYFLLNKKTQT